MHDTIDFRDLQLEITHACNLRCRLCDHRIRSSQYSGLTRSTYRWIGHCLGSFRDEITRVVLTGGEPLVHPEFTWLCARVGRDFPRATILVRTNGVLLNRLPPRLFSKLVFMVSWLPGKNDDVCRYRNRKNVIIKRVGQMEDPYRDPALPEERARALRGVCSWRRFRVVGARVYDCCLAEALERSYGLPAISADMSPNWRQEVSRFETWRACRHCYKAYELGFASG
jgi:hypothetical protein